MTQDTKTADFIGEFRIPTNTAQSAKGSIHDDATASKLGFRGGTVAGSLHMDQYTPQLMALYGDDWWARGNMSVYFRQATVNAEPVRSFARRGDPQARLWMENEAGDLINEGTASCTGADTDTELTRRLAGQATAAPDSLRILAGAKVGDEVTDLTLNVPLESMKRRLETIPETLPVYEGERPILPPSMAVNLYRGAQTKLYRFVGEAVGLFGAIELQFLKGPLRADTDYKVRAKILALSESPKTENVWYQAWAADPETGEDLGWMIMYLRYMKASSKLWGG